MPNSTEYTNETTRTFPARNERSLISGRASSVYRLLVAVDNHDALHVISPGSSEDVADILSVLRAAQTQFCRLAHGHMPIKGAVSTDQGFP